MSIPFALRRAESSAVDCLEGVALESFNRHDKSPVIVPVLFGEQEREYPSKLRDVGGMGHVHCGREASRKAALRFFHYGEIIRGTG